MDFAIYVDRIPHEYIREFLLIDWHHSFIKNHTIIGSNFSWLGTFLYFWDKLLPDSCWCPIKWFFELLRVRNAVSLILLGEAFCFIRIRGERLTFCCFKVRVFWRIHAAFFALIYFFFNGSEYSLSDFFLGGLHLGLNTCLVFILSDRLDIGAFSLSFWFLNLAAVITIGTHFLDFCASAPTLIQRPNN